MVLQESLSAIEVRFLSYYPRYFPTRGQNSEAMLVSSGSLEATMTSLFHIDRLSLRLNIKISFLASLRSSVCELIVQDCRDEMSMVGVDCRASH